MEKDWFKVEKNEVIKRLKISLDSKDLQFIGKYETSEDKDFGFFKDVRSLSGVRKYYPTNLGERDIEFSRPVKVVFYNEGKRKVLENGKWYKFYATLSHASLAIKQDNPFLLQTDLSKASEIIEFTGHELIENIQQDALNTPESVKGKLTRSIEAISNEINTQAATFIFELIQNADDYPNSDNNVQVSFEIKNDYLIVKHNGAPFEVNNTVAICDINEGDKRGEIEKIGFKGIGFKSIFKDCNLAYIKSGEYSFRFDEQKWRVEGRDLFWQITPINTDETKYQSLIGKIDSVNLAIKPREEEKLDQYRTTFKENFKDERILLFLRNIKEVHFNLGNDNFSISALNNKWNIKKEEGIVINEETKATLERGIALNDKRIPLKFKGIEKTEISFGFNCDDNRVNFLDDATIYAYLPTKVNLGFGFLLNANFIPDGSRTLLHNDLSWNEYLFEKAGELFPFQLLKLIEEGLDKSSILNLIPDFEELLSNQNKDNQIFIEAFKRGFDSCKEEVNFIPNINEELIPISNIIIDESGIYEYVKEDFYSLFDIEGELVSVKIDKKTKKKLKKQLQEIKPNSIFTLDRLYDSFKNGKLESWLLIPENNIKFICYLSEDLKIFNKFKSEAIILGHGIFNEESKKLYAAHSLYYDLPKEAEFINLTVVYKPTFEAILSNNLDFNLKIYNVPDFLRIILENINQLKSNPELLLRAWHYLFINKDVKSYDNFIVNQRFKVLPIFTINGELRNLHECYAGDVEKSESDFSFLYQEYGSGNFTKVDVQKLTVSLKVDSKEIVDFLIRICNDVKLTDRILFKKAFKELLEVSNDQLKKQPEKVIKALISVFNYNSIYPNDSLVNAEIINFPVISSNNKIVKLGTTYFDENFKNLFEEDALYAHILFEDVDNINYISKDYLDKLESDKHKKFIEFLITHNVSPGIKLFHLYQIKNQKNNYYNVAAYDASYSDYNGGYSEFSTENKFILVSDLQKIEGRYSNLSLFWDKFSKLNKSFYLFFNDVTCTRTYNYKHPNPFVWMITKKGAFCPLKNGDVSRFNEVYSPELSNLLFDECLLIDSSIDQNLFRFLKDKITFKTKLENKHIINALELLDKFSFEQFKVLSLEHFCNATFTQEEINIIHSKCKLFAADESIQKICNLIYFDKSLENCPLEIESAECSEINIVHSFNYNQRFKEVLEVIGVPCKGINNVEIKSVENDSQENSERIKSIIIAFASSLLKASNDLDFLSESKFIKCSQITIGIDSIINFDTPVDSYYDNKTNAYYYIEYRDLADVICDQFNWPLFENRKLRNQLKASLESYPTTDTGITTVVNDVIQEYKITFSNDEVNQLSLLFGRNLSEDELKEENLYAHVKAVRYLKDNGYDTSIAEEYFQENYEDRCLYPVVKNGVKYKVMCRSAIRGILYLGAYSWTQLEKENTILFILKGSNSYECDVIHSGEELELKYATHFKVIRRKDANYMSTKNLINSEINKEDLQLLYKVSESKLDSIFDPRENETGDTEGGLTDIGNLDI
jgi:hypothetical protein